MGMSPQVGGSLDWCGHSGRTNISAPHGNRVLVSLLPSLWSSKPELWT